MKFLKRLLCKHVWKKSKFISGRICFDTVSEAGIDTILLERLCKKCGKVQVIVK